MHKCSRTKVCHELVESDCVRVQARRMVLGSRRLATVTYGSTEVLYVRKYYSRKYYLRTEETRTPGHLLHTDEQIVRSKFCQIEVLPSYYFRTTPYEYDN